VRHMLDKIEQTCHLINREKVVHGVWVTNALLT
jgi:hypothetical protein